MTTATLSTVQLAPGQAAWRRFRGDRVGMVSITVVLVFLVMIVLTATGVVAK